MRVRFLVRSLLVVGGSTVVALPLDYIRRKKLAHGVKILVEDCGEQLVISCLTEDKLRLIHEDAQHLYRVSESKRLKVLQSRYRHEKIDQKTKGGPTWLSKSKSS